ncbi:MAG: hypothetical protein JSU96_21160, partial [Acidobacteriota bacterium]
ALTLRRLSQSTAFVKVSRKIDGRPSNPRFRYAPPSGYRTSPPSGGFTAGLLGALPEARQGRWVIARRRGRAEGVTEPRVSGRAATDDPAPEGGVAPGSWPVLLCGPIRIILLSNLFLKELI